MALIEIEAARTMSVDPERAYTCLANYRDHHHRILPPAFSRYHVEAGGIGAGTIVGFRVTVAGRPLDYRISVAEPEPGRVLVETDAATQTMTRFSVTPVPTGCQVRMITTWPAARGMFGVIERLTAPRFLRGLYADELARLEAYARQLESTAGEARQP